MSMMPMARSFPPRFDLGRLLGSIAMGGAPGAYYPPAPPALGPGGAALAESVQGPAPMPTPQPRAQFTSPAAGGVPPPPTNNGGEPIQPALRPGYVNPFALAVGDAPTRVDVPNIDMPPPAAPAPPEHKGRSKGQIIAGILADALSGFVGQPGRVAPMWAAERQREAEQDYEASRWHRERSAKREDELRPRVEEVGGAVGMLDPAARKFEPFYSKPQVFESYARAQGYEPGTPEYAQAVEDYRLGSWSDPALENRADLEEFRGDERSALETIRAANRLREVRERQRAARRAGTRPNAGPKAPTPTTVVGRIMDKQSRGEQLTPAERQTLSEYRVGKGRGARAGSGGTSDGAIIRNPQTGERMMLKGGKWVPVK